MTWWRWGSFQVNQPLAWTGARVSEVLALTRISFQVESGIVAVHTLKQRRHVVREVPIPPELMQALDRRFKMSAVSGSPDKAMARLWPWSRIDPRGGNMLIAAESYAAR